MSGTRRLHEIVASALCPPPRLSVVEFGERYRVLSEDEAEPGPWRVARTPYMAEILNRLSPYDDCEEVVLMKGAQLGGTEAVLLAIAYWIKQVPGRILVVMPGEDEAKDFSQQRLRLMIRDTPELQRLIRTRRIGPGRPRGDSIFLKEFPGGSLKMTGSNAPEGLRSKPVRYLLGDEVDGWAVDSGGEGCPLIIAEKRLGTFPGRKAYYDSTPGVEPSRIERRFLAGDRRYYHVPCPECDHMFVMRFATFVIPEVDGRRMIEDAHMVCPDCGSVIEEWRKEAMLAGGEWRATAPYNGRRRSYHLSAFYSPLGWLSWAQIADEWTRAQDNPIELKAVVNTVFGEVWRQESGEGLDVDAIHATREDWGDRAPGRILVITAGCDIQKDRVEVEVVGWGPGYESWSLDHVIIPGDPTGEAIWDDLDAVLLRRYELDDGTHHPIAATGIDVSYEGDRVFRFTRDRIRRRVWAVRGAADEARVRRPIWPPRWRKSRRTAGSYALIGTGNAKRDIYNWLAKPGTGPGPGRCHFPDDRPREWFRQLTAERWKPRWHRGQRWVEWELPSGRRNEALDCRVYAYAVLLGLETAGFTWARARQLRDVERALLDGHLPGRENEKRARTEDRARDVPQRDWF